MKMVRVCEVAERSDLSSLRPAQIQQMKMVRVREVAELSDLPCLRSAQLQQMKTVRHLNSSRGVGSTQSAASPTPADEDGERLRSCWAIGSTQSTVSPSTADEDGAALAKLQSNRIYPVCGQPKSSR